MTLTFCNLSVEAGTPLITTRLECRNGHGIATRCLRPWPMTPPPQGGGVLFRSRFISNCAIRLRLPRTPSPLTNRLGNKPCECINPLDPQAMVRAHKMLQTTDVPSAEQHPK